jgi:DNA-binding NarL/FixJ family response regulator
VARPAKIRVLLADDHAVLRAGLKLLVNAEPDMEVVAEAGDAGEALRLALETGPDVAVLDLSMPGGGLKAVEALAGQCPKTRVLVLTMHDDPAYLRSAMAAGAAGYVVKKVADRELLSSVRAVYHGATIAFLSNRTGALGATGLGEPFPNRGLGRATLSNREQEVLVLLARGYTNRQIAQRLRLSVKSVETYRSRLLQKLGLKNRADIVSYALGTGVLSPESAAGEPRQDG